MKTKISLLLYTVAHYGRATLQMPNIAIEFVISDPLSTCKIYQNNKLIDVGTALRKHGDKHDPYVAAKQALVSALRWQVKVTRTAIWDYLFASGFYSLDGLELQVHFPTFSRVMLYSGHFEVTTVDRTTIPPTLITKQYRYGK